MDGAFQVMILAVEHRAHRERIFEDDNISSRNIRMRYSERFSAPVDVLVRWLVAENEPEYFEFSHLFLWGGAIRGLLLIRFHHDLYLLRPYRSFWIKIRSIGRRKTPDVLVV